MKKLVFVAVFMTVICLAGAGLAGANDAKVFTADDFKYIPDFSVSPDKDFKKAFICPGYGDVIRGFGKPESETEDALGFSLEYEFGEINLRLDGGKPDTLWLKITEEELEGPRGIKVGYPYEKVLGAFKSNLEAFPKGKFQADLYSEGKQPAPAYTGIAFMDSKTGKVTSLYYWHGNRRGSIAISVNFIIEDGVVASIMWRIDKRA